MRAGVSGVCVRVFWSLVSGAGYCDGAEEFRSYCRDTCFLRAAHFVHERRLYAAASRHSENRLVGLSQDNINRKYLNML